MKNIKLTLPLLLFIVFNINFNVANVAAKTNNTSISTANLNGTWVINNIEAKDFIEIYVNKENSESIGNSMNKKEGQKMSIPLEKILQEELSIGNTKFVFNNGTFDFYRKSSLTFSGNFSLDMDQLTLKYKSGNNENVKVNKIIKLSDKILVMESESYNKKVVFTFIKK